MPNFHDLYIQAANKRYSVIGHVVAGVLFLLAAYMYFENDMQHAQILLLFSITVGIGSIYHSILEFEKRVADKFGMKF